MGKQAKKKQKSATQAATQHHHNQATKGSNTKKRPIMWSRVRLKNGDFYEITVQPNTQWDWSRTHDAVTLEDGTTKLMAKKPRQNLYEPFDRLLDDWSENLRGFAEHHEAKISREVLGENSYRYTVYVDWKDVNAPGGKWRETLLTIDSSKNYNFGSSRKRRKRGA